MLDHNQNAEVERKEHVIYINCDPPVAYEDVQTARAQVLVTAYIVRKVSPSEGRWLQLKFGLLSWARSVVLAVGGRLLKFKKLRWAGLKIRKFEAWVFGGKSLPFVQSHGKSQYLTIPLDEADSWARLCDLGVVEAEDIEPVYDLGDGRYLTAYWFFDGISDGIMEYNKFAVRVNRFFEVID